MLCMCKLPHHQDQDADLVALLDAVLADPDHPAAEA